MIIMYLLYIARYAAFINTLRFLGKLVLINIGYVINNSSISCNSLAL